jgi:hypothetical protein
MTAEPFTVNFSFDERRLRTALRSLRDAEALALKAGAAKADEVSRSGFRYRRPSAPPRAGRSSTQGKMTEHVDWKVERGAVRLDVKKLDRAAPHWIIQEIGTGQRATITNMGEQLGQGRPTRAAAAQYVRTVKSQKGRKISASLAFGTSPGGQFVPAGAGRGQQLYRRRDLTGSPFRPRRITIRNEIHGQHFVRDGARAGYREYRRTMLGAARRTFAGQKSRP